MYWQAAKEAGRQCLRLSAIRIVYSSSHAHFFCGFFSLSQFFVVSLQKKAAMDFVASQLHSALQASKLDALLSLTREFTS